MRPTWKRIDRWADPAKVEPHIPVHSIQVNACETCHHIIGFAAEHDPVHAVARPCIHGCGTEVPAFHYQCQPCADKFEAKRERERLARLGKAQPQTEDDGRVPADRPSGSGGEVDPEYRKAYGEAVRYLREYTGTFDFLLDMREKLDATSKYEQKLSKGQVEAVLKCKARDDERVKEQAEKRKLGTAIDLTVLPTGTTRYAVENMEGDLTFIKVDHLDDGKWAGWVFVKQVVGGADDRNLPRLGSQKPGALYQGTFERLLLKVLADPVGAAQRYGLELGECSVCGRTLTDADSRAAGIGPKCAERYAA